MRVVLYERMTNVLMTIFNEVDFTWKQDRGGYLISTTDGYQLPWTARHPAFTKDEKIEMNNLIANGNIFFHLGPKWFCFTDNYAEMKHSLINEMPVNHNGLRLTNFEERVIKTYPESIMKVSRELHYHIRETLQLGTSKIT